ncbi:MAG: hypothetical protein AAF438_04310 [Pseudomonadota bacterium]
MPPGTGQTDQSKIQIAQRVYDDARLPVNFYSEPVRDPTAFYNVQHVRSGDVAQTGDYEMCSDDFATALSWSEQLNGSQSLSGDLVETEESSMLFEFSRVLSNTPDRYRIERVFKCSYLDRTTLDPITGSAGVVNVRPLATSDVKTIAEYFWTFSAYNNVGSIVLESTSESDDEVFSHTLSLARLLVGAGSNGCDYVELIHWQYDAHRTNGELNSREEPMGGFSARKEGSNVTLCQ